MDAVTTFDMNILHWIHENLSCGFLDIIMPAVTALGEYGLLWIAAAAVMLFFRKYRVTSAAIAGALLGCLVVGNIALKHIVARSRPCWLETDVPMLIAIPRDFSFPSGHTTTSFAAAVVIFHYNKRLGIPALIIAALIAFSRLYLFVHFPTDVLAGAAIGCAIGIAAFVIADRIAGRIRNKRAQKQ